MIDTHTHLYSEEFDSDREAVIKKAIESGVDKMLLPNIDSGSIEPMHRLVRQFPQHCFPMMGLHPCSVKDNWEKELEIIKSRLDHGNYCAVGEIGIDLYWDKTTFPMQEQAFRVQVEWAKEKKLPVVIHVRDAFDETLAILDQLNDNRLKGVFHCFTGNTEQARHILGYGGFMLGIGGVVTFKNGGLDKVLPGIGLEHLVLETDSPYLAPVPHRGKRNESAYLQLIADRLAVVLETDVQTVKRITAQNALELFNTVK